MNRTIGLMLLSASASILWPFSSPAFETSTHRLINQRAAESLVLSDSSETFDDFLRYQLLFPDGHGTIVNGQSIRDWLGTGGVAEDQFMPDTLGQKLGEIAGGVTRSPRHFHTPLRAWDQSGLILGGFQFESSPRWAQLADQGVTGKAAWGDARQTYFQALTESDPGQRATLFGNTFKILGQLMHLVADMASVAHTRNAQHILGDLFETFVEKRDALVTGFQGMDPSYVRYTPTNDAVATVPVARLWDTDTYDGSNPDITAQATNSGATVGLAEFTSANFFSQHTISKVAGADPILPYPAIDQLEPLVDTLPNGNQRQYWRKTGQGIPIDHMVLESAFNLFEPSTWWRFSLDKKVLEDYAAELLPRAIGYSAGLLDYFFRGDMTPFSNTGELYPITNPPTTISFPVVNNTPDEDTGTGTLTLVLRYVAQYNTSESFPDIVVSADTVQTVTRSSQDVPIPLNGTVPFPATIGPDCDPLLLPYCGSQVAYAGQLIYRGPLGGENESVVVTNCGVNFHHDRFTDLSEGIEVVVLCGGPQ